MNDLENDKVKIRLISLRSRLLDAISQNKSLLARHCNPTTDKDYDNFIDLSAQHFNLSSSLKITDEALEIISPNWEKILDEYNERNKCH